MRLSQKVEGQNKFKLPPNFIRFSRPELPESSKLSGSSGQEKRIEFSADLQVLQSFEMRHLSWV
jgi:hypothetical protein